MNIDNGRENFSLGMDLSKLQNDADKASSILAGIGDAAVKEGQRMDNALSSVNFTNLQEQIKQTQESITENANAIKANNEEVAVMSKTLGGLQLQLSNTTKGTDAFNELTARIKSTSDTIEATNANSQQMASESDTLKAKLTELQQAYSNLSQSAGEAGTAMNATGGQNAVAGQAEGAAIAQTSAELSGKTAAEIGVADATMQASNAASEAAINNNEESESLKQLKQELKQAQTNLEDIAKAQDEFNGASKIDELTNKIERYQNIINELKANGATPTGYDSESANMRNYQTQLEQVQKQLEQVQITQNRLNGDAQQYNETAANLKVKVDGWDDAKHKAEAYKQEVEKVPGIHEQITSTMKTIGSIAAGYFSIQAAQQFVTQLVDVRKEMELLETQFKGLMGAEKGGEIFSGIKDMAMKSGVYQIKELSQAAETMNVYGISVEQIMPMLNEFGDVAMGNQQKLQSLAMAFGRLESEGQLTSLTLRTLTRAGFNPLDIIAQQTGKSMADVRKEMTAGQLTTDRVKQALKAATSEGGKFNNSMSNLSTTIAGEQGRLSTMIEETMNSIGEEHAEGIKDAFKFGQTLVQNYEAIGKSIATLIAFYGSYRAALILSGTVEAALTGQYVLRIRLMRTLAVAHKAVIALENANPYVLLTTAVLSLAAAVLIFKKNTDASKLANEEYQKKQDELRESEDKHRQKIEQLTSAIENGNGTIYDRISAFRQLKKEYPNILKNIRTYTEYLQNQEIIEKRIAQSEAYQPVQKAKNTVADYKNLVAKREALISELKAEQQQASMDGDNTRVGLIYDQIRQAMVGLDSAKQNLKKSEKDLANAQSDYKKNMAETQKQSKIQNKEYWENQKKYAQAQMDAMGDSEMGSAAWNKQKKLYEEADRHLQSRQIESDKQRQSAAKSAESAAEKERKAQEKRNEEKKKLAEQETEITIQNQQKQIDLMDDGSEKKLKQIDVDYNKEIAEIKKKENEIAKTNKEAGVKNTNAKDSEGKLTGLTQDQQNQINESIALANTKKEKMTKEVYDNEALAMQEFLKQYGTYEQQKLAITEEYAEKIRKAATEGEKLTLEQQRDKELKDVESKATNANIDWYTVFDGLGGIFENAIKQQLVELQKYVRTDAFQSKKPEDQQKIIEAMNNLRQQVGSTSQDWHDLAEALQNYQQALQDKEAAEKEVTEANKELRDFRKEHAIVGKDGKENYSLEDQKTFDKLSTSAAQAAQNLEQTNGKVKTSGTLVATTAKDVTQPVSEITAFLQKANLGQLAELFGAFDQLRGAIAGLKALNNASDAAKGLKDAGKNISDAGKTASTALSSIGDKASDALSKGLGEAGFIGQIISAVLEIINVLKDGISPLISSILDSIYSAVNGMLKDVLSGKIVTNILGSVINGTKNILNTLTFGGLNSWTRSLTSGNSKEVHELVDKLTKSNDALKVSIDALKNKIDSNNGTKSLDAYERAYKAQENLNSNLQKILDTQMNYHSAHHSNAYYWDLSGTSMQAINDLLGTSLKNSWEDFSKLTAEQMNDIRTYLPEVWTEMIDQGEYGDRFKSDWENYAEQAEKLQELTDEINQNLTQVTFDSFRDNYLDTLMDMKSDTQDFTDDINQYFMKSLLNYAVGDELDARLKTFYEKWASTMKNQNGKLTQQQIEDYRSEYEAMAQYGLDQRDMLAKVTGYKYTNDTSQSGSTNSLSNMSQDTGDELSGRAAAIQVAVYNIQDAVNAQAANYAAINGTASEIHTQIDDMMDMQRQGIDHLEKIEKYTSELPGIAKDISKVKQYTSKL